MIHNAFSKHYVSEINAKAAPQDVRLYNAITKAERTELVLALAPSQTFKGATEPWAKEGATC